MLGPGRTRLRAETLHASFMEDSQAVELHGSPRIAATISIEASLRRGGSKEIEAAGRQQSSRLPGDEL